MRALLLSLVSHIVLLMLVMPRLHSSDSRPAINVRLVREQAPSVSPPLPKQPVPPQIVPPSEVASTPPPETNQLSERDSSVEREQLKRGDAGNEGISVQPLRRPQPPVPDRSPAAMSTSKPQNPELKSPPQEKKVTAPQTPAEVSPREVPAIARQPAAPERAPKLPMPKEAVRKETLPREPVLQLSSSVLAQKLYEHEQQKAVEAKKPQPPTALRSQADYTPFRRSVSPSVVGRLGSPDHLPTIQDGEITLLNAKADKYAVFVRRVALQVFGVLRSLSWSNLNPSQISQLQQFTEVRAILSATGELERVELGGSSGVGDFDKLLQEAAKRGAWDQNPPQGALSTDGKIHFVFRAKSWARPAAGGMGEQRWLLLSTGLL